MRFPFQNRRHLGVAGSPSPPGSPPPRCACSRGLRESRIHVDYRTASNPILARRAIHPAASSSAGAADHLRHGAFRTVRPTLSQRWVSCLAHSVHLPVDGSIQRGQPFIIHHQCFDFALCELGIVRIDLGIKSCFGILYSPFQVCLLRVELQPFTQYGGFSVASCRP